MDTIFAVSSGRPPAAVAVIRISGPDAMAAATALAGSLPPPRRAGVRTLRDAAGSTLDRALVLAFPGPATATGEDLAELHCHGGRAVIDAVTRALAAQPGVRGAEAGEFTRRALTNGRIDLAQAEGLADLLAAETEAQRRAAMASAEGVVSRAIRGWIDRLAMLAAEVEAGIDFADEGDVAATVRSLDLIVADGRQLGADIRAATANPPVERLRDGIRVVIAGPANSGKSTLLNRLAEREAAIVTPIAGTTRDRIEVPVSRNGIAYLLTDTAGLTESDDAVERIGVTLSHEAIAQADVLLWMGDAAPPTSAAIHIHARADLPNRSVTPAACDVAISKTEESGLARLWALVDARATTLLPALDRLTLSRRQIDACVLAGDTLDELADDEVLVAESLRRAHRCLGKILGINATEAMLESLFARFCIGK